jgi:hypothetical protein
MKKITEEDIKELFLGEGEFEPVLESGPEDPDAPSLDELREKIRNGEITFKIPSQLHVMDLEEYVDEILTACGLEGAMVTDLSMMGHFDLSEEEAEEAMEQLGVHMEPGDYVYQVAQRLKDSRE